MRVLYLINHAGKAGTEKYVYNLVKRFGGTETECFFVFNETGPLAEQMEELGIIGPFEGAKPRALLITRQQWQERQFIHGTAPIETLPEEETADDDAPF